MKSKTWFSYFVLPLLILLLVLGGCQSEEDEAVVITQIVDADIQSVFTPTSSTAISNSIISLPASLKGSSGSSNIVRPLYAADGTSDSGLVGIYSGIQNYVSFAEMFKDLLKSLMTEIVASNLMQLAALNTPVIIPEDASDPDAPRKFKIEKLIGETYAWKLSLYFDVDAVDPAMVLRFNISGGAAQGQMLWKMTETDSELTNAGITGVEVIRYVDVTFNGMSNPKTLDVKLIQDLSQHRTYADANWSTLSDLEKAALDLGQPEKVFVTAEYNTTDQVFTIYGTSYHPGWETESTLNGEEMTWGPERSMYMFKAKADESADGAKLFLAIPLETRTDASADLWETDSISNVFTDMMLENINGFLAGLADATDDLDTDGDAGADLSVSEEQERADFMLSYILYPAITELHTYTQEEYDAAAAYWATHPDLGSWFTNPCCNTLANFNAWNAARSLSTKSDIGDDWASQIEIYAWVMVAKADARAATNGSHDVTKAEMHDFVTGDVLSDGQSFKDQYQSISYLINPAFYSDTSGFLGTYDTSSDVFYKYANSSLDATTDQSPIAALKNLDLSNITSHIPATVKAATITIE